MNKYYIKINAVFQYFISYIAVQSLKYLNRAILVLILQNLYDLLSPHTYLPSSHAKCNLNRNLTADLSYLMCECGFYTLTALFFYD